MEDYVRNDVPETYSLLGNRKLQEIILNPRCQILPFRRLASVGQSKGSSLKYRGNELQLRKHGEYSVREALSAANKSTQQHLQCMNWEYFLSVK